MWIGKYPEAASTVIEFECACVGDSERICHATGDGDLFVMKSSRIAIDGFNAYARASGEQQNCADQAAELDGSRVVAAHGDHFLRFDFLVSE